MLYKLTYSYLMSICIRYAKNEDRAKEVLNLGFYRILKNLEKYRPDVPFKAWIRRVMINTLINEFKKEKIHYRHVEYVDTYYETQDYSDINEAVTRMDIDQVYSLISKLPVLHQQVFNLFFVDGYKHKEIADLLEINENTSKWYLTVAKDKLKEMIQSLEPVAKR